MHSPKVKTAVAIDNHTLLIAFDNQQSKTYDVTPLLSRVIFEPLKDQAIFKNLVVETGGYAVAWGSDIDISEYELWQNGENYSGGLQGFDGVHSV